MFKKLLVGATLVIGAGAMMLTGSAISAVMKAG